MSEHTRDWISWSTMIFVLAFGTISILSAVAH